MSGREPVADPMRTGIIRGSGEAEIAELAAKLLQQLRRCRDRLMRIERIAKPVFFCRLWHELRDAQRAGVTDGVVAQSALLPNQVGKELNRQPVVLCRGE